MTTEMFEIIRESRSNSSGLVYNVCRLLGEPPGSVHVSLTTHIMPLGIVIWITTHYARLEIKLTQHCKYIHN